MDGMKIISALCLVMLVQLCSSPAQTFPEGFFNPERVKQGEELSRTLCSSCHVWPAPEILDRDTWLNGPLPWMMGVVGLSPDSLPHGLEGSLIQNSGAVLTKAPVSKEDYGKIIAFYLQTAPTNMAMKDYRPAPLTMSQFTPHVFPYWSPSPMALVVQFDGTTRTLFLGDANSSSLLALNIDGVTNAQIRLPSPAVALKVVPGGLYVTCVGSYSPSEQAKGSVVFVPRDQGGYGNPKVVLDHLVRPVCTDIADLNGDGLEDLLVCIYGWYSGRLSWFENKGAGRYEEHELITNPGAVRAEVRDLNNDGHLDIAVLFAQSQEKLSFLYNDGHGEFTEKVIFQKHPAFGHVYFEFADMNGDGRLDIIAANGDNGDYPSPPKPYHGVRVYLNQGGEDFKESYFYPLPGAYKAMARDFDGDGDLDLACIAYYPDYHASQNDGFVYLENQGDLEFKPSTFADSSAGRWLTMDVGDFDGDGDDDIAIGAAIKGPGKEVYVPHELTARWKEAKTTCILLQNNLVESTGAIRDKDQTSHERH